ncbi:MAG: methyltransferase domain-containing protein [Candidatus Omnitrophota bacterium]
MERKFTEEEGLDTKEVAEAYSRLQKIYHFWICRPQINTVLRIAKKIQSQKQAEGGVSILDIGCGPGQIPIDIAKRLADCKVTAVDISSNMLEVARNNAKVAGVLDRVSFKLADGNKLGFADNSFDIVMCSNMLHHQKNPYALLSEMKRTVNKGGVIVIVDIVRPPSRFIVNMLAAALGFWQTKIMKEDYRASFYSAFSIEEFKGMLESAGLQNSIFRKFFPYSVIIVNGK